jgi:Ca-activated chloride channel family protein
VKFFYPEFLWFLLLVPFFIILGIRRFFAGEKFLKMSGQNRDLESYRLILGIKMFLLVLTFVCFYSFLVLSLTEPVMGTHPVLEDNDGSDICFVVDVSRSMLVGDLTQSRIDLARDCLHLLIRDLEDCRFSLVVFSGESYTLVPMTEDLSALENSLLYLTPGTVTNSGSNIENALLTAMGLFPEGVNRRKLIILVSDGEALTGTAPKAARKLRDSNIKIYTLGVGTEQGGIIPLSDGEPLTDERGKTVISRLERGNLEALSNITGGLYFEAGDPDGLNNLIKIINSNTSLAKRTGIRYHKAGNYQLYLWLSFVFLILNFLFRNIRWKRYI